MYGRYLKYNNIDKYTNIVKRHLSKHTTQSVQVIEVLYYLYMCMISSLLVVTFLSITDPLLGKVPSEHDHQRLISEFLISLVGLLIVGNCIATNIAFGKLLL